MSEDIISLSYIGKVPLLRPLKNLSGQFFLFQQYSNDLTNFLGNNSGIMPIPKTFYCLNLNLPDPTAHDNDNLIPENEQNEPVESNIMSISDLVEAQNGVLCKELMYKGDISVLGKDNIDGMNYNEIYCHINNDAKRQKFRLYLQNNYDCKYEQNSVLGYGAATPPYYQFTDYGTYIGDILQNEYENGNTFFNINFNDIPISDNWDTNYYLGRLLYVLYKNGMITFADIPDENDNSLYDDEPDVSDYQQDQSVTSNDSSNLSPTVTNITTPISSSSAGVLSNKALFDDIVVEDDNKKGVYTYFKTNQIERTDLNKVKFQFNAILVCYGFKNMTTNEWEPNTEIPMGLYFTGFDKNPNDATDLGNFVNVFTKYYKNLEIYNQGTSYTLRICSRTLSSQATDTSEVVTNIISASNTGEWVNEYEFLMSKFDETYNTLKSVKNQYANMYDNIQENLDRFRNNRTNVPYIRQVGTKKYWFVNGVNTLQEVIDASVGADWNNPDDQVFPGFQRVTIYTSAEDNIDINPSSIIVYLGTRTDFNITLQNSSTYPYFEVTSENDTLSYDCAEIFTQDVYDYYDNENYIHIHKDSEDDRNYTFTFMNVLYGCTLTASLSQSQNI